MRMRCSSEGLRRLVGAPRSQPTRSPAERARALLALAEPLDGIAVRSAATDAGPMWLDANDRLTTPWIVEHGSWEPDISALLRRLLAPGGHFVDVGANIGYFSVLAAGIVGARGSVLSVEPEPTTVRILRANLWRNGCDNAVALRMAAYAERTHIRLVSYPEARAGSWVDASGTEEGTMVPCAPLDDLLAGRRADVIKIDAEGVDHHIVAGMRHAWVANPDLVVITELWTQQERGGKGCDEILAGYAERNLRVSLLVDGGREEPLTPTLLASARAEHQIVNVVLRAG